MGASGLTYMTPILETGEMMGGTPWEQRDRYIENSPIFYLDRIETPLLILHGSEDSAVSSYQAGEVFVGLRRLGKEVVYAKYFGEEHDPGEWRLGNQLDYCQRLIAWFDDHLKKMDDNTQNLPRQK
jgi:dipeptidyl aminopeptidase/acylaminoacyl peptidase